MSTTFKNESGLKFVDISSEESRVYDWGDGRKVTIQDPLQLNVSSSGGHRVFDATGVSHYVPHGWIHISWRARQGSPNFVK